MLPCDKPRTVVEFIAERQTIRNFIHSRNDCREGCQVHRDVYRRHCQYHVSSGEIKMRSHDKNVVTQRQFLRLISIKTRSFNVFIDTKQTDHNSDVLRAHPRTVRQPIPNALSVYQLSPIYEYTYTRIYCDSLRAEGRRISQKKEEHRLKEVSRETLCRCCARFWYDTCDKVVIDCDLTHQSIWVCQWIRQRVLVSLN